VKAGEIIRHAPWTRTSTHCVTPHQWGRVVFLVGAVVVVVDLVVLVVVVDHDDDYVDVVVAHIHITFQRAC
jgi:hypothetical protein